MGRIRHVQLGTIHELEGYTVVGRASHCVVLIADHRVSNEHACLKWRGECWVVRDLASTNGTWVNGQSIRVGADLEIQRGDEMAFGARTSVWVLDDDGAPQPMAAPVGGEGVPCVLVEGVIAIPSSDNAAATIYRGADGIWMLETSDRVAAIVPGETFESSKTTFRFSCPVEWEATSKVRHFRLVQESDLHFQVSSDEEHVTLRAEHQGEEIPLGQISGYYLLLTLARIRSTEQRSHASAESGWIHRDELMKMLRCGEQQLNVWIHRIRSRFATNDFLDYASVIERRDGSGQLRIGVERCFIHGASS